MTPFEHAQVSPMLIERKEVKCCFLLLAKILSPFVTAKHRERVVCDHSLNFLHNHPLFNTSNLVAPTPFHSVHSFEGHQLLESQTFGLSSGPVPLGCLEDFDAINHFPFLVKPFS